MITKDDYIRVLPIFAAAFAVIYLVAEQQNWALVTYHPRDNAWDFLVKVARGDIRTHPAMYWFGWIGTSFLGAAAISLAAMPLTKDRELPSWIGWAIPLAVMVVFVYLFRNWFLR